MTRRLFLFYVTSLRYAICAAAFLCAVSVLFSACGSDATPASNDGGNDGGVADSAADSGTPDVQTPDGKGDDSGPAKTNTLLADGGYFVGIKLSLAGTQLKMKAVITAEGEQGKGGKLLTFDIYGLGAADDWVSPTPMGTAKDVVVKADGTFTASFGLVTIPAKSSPTGTPVSTNLAIVGTIDSANNTFCGDLSGDIPAFSANLKGSTFKAVAFGEEATPYLVSCNATVKIYKHITTCPTLKAGVNTFKSAEFDRSLILDLPAAATATGGAKLPLVLLYHGNGGTAAGILKATGWPLIQATETKDPFILVTPSTTAKVGDSKPVLDWRYGEKAFDMDNRELVFFDDVVKCVSAQYNGDPDRVYVTGMSGGAMMTTFLTANRSKTIAAAVPLSGGYLHPWPKDAAKVPMLVVWGGATDFAFSQNFDLLAKALMKDLTDAGTFFAFCNHKLGHTIPFSLVPHTWTFLKAQRRGQASSPMANGLPSDFPSYCSLPKK